MARRHRPLVCAALTALLLSAAACSDDPPTEGNTSSEACGVEGGPCDDGDPCTIGDHCSSGACVGGAERCACRVDDDCAFRTAADRCVGRFTCDTAVVPHRCVYKPGSAVHCDTGSDTLCSQQRCDPATGKCAAVPAPTGTPCADGDPCTAEDTCVGGVCKSGAAQPCPCLADADCGAQEDGDACNGTLYCDTTEGRCVVNPTTVVSCADPKKTCHAAACQPATGQCATLPLPDGTPCDDGEDLTVDDRCKAGTCAGLQIGKCTSTKDCAIAEDGDPCNGTLYCDIAKGACVVNPATVVTCSTSQDTACVKNTCVALSVGAGAKATCLMLPVTSSDAGGAAVKVPCDDGQPCTLDDHCAGGVCVGGTNTCLCKSDQECQAKFGPSNLCIGTWFCNKTTAECELNAATAVVCNSVDDTACAKAMCEPATGACSMAAMVTGTACDDGDPCSAKDFCASGVCQPGADVCSCKSDADCKDKTDGDKCKGPWYCDKAAKPFTCKPNPAKQVVCPSVGNTACRTNACDPATGACKVVFTAAGTTCDDGDPCTASSFCLDGGCSGGVKTCVCTTHADCAAKEDGDLCNGTLYCDKSDPAKPACKLNPATVITCPEDPAYCVKSACNPATGACLKLPDNAGKPCTDGDPCTLADVCAGGTCVGGTPKLCDDKDACTIDACVAGKGCTFVAKGCDDGNDCTLDSCAKATGKCVFTAAPMDGKTCNADDDGCTVNDTCVAGSCKVGGAALCNKATGPCEADACQSFGPLAFACAVVAKPDGAACVDGQSCFVGAVCKQGVCDKGDKARLFTRAAALPEKLPVSKAGAKRTSHYLASSVNAVLVQGDALFVAGRIQESAKYPGSSLWDDAGGLWVRRIALGAAGPGSTSWELRLLSTSLPKAAQSSHGMAALGMHVTGGTLDVMVTTKERPLLIQLDASKGSLIAVGKTPATGSTTGQDATWLPGGGWLVPTAKSAAALSTYDDPRKGGWWRFDAKGNPLQHHALPKVAGSLTKGTVAPLGSASDQAGGALLVGAGLWTAVGERPCAWRITSNDKVLWTTAAITTWRGRLHGVAKRAAGWVAAGWKAPGSKAAPQPWVVALDGAGKVLWERTEPGLAGDLRRIRVVGKGLVAIGTRKTTPTSMWVVGLDDIGRRRWQWLPPTQAPGDQGVVNLGKVGTSGYDVAVAAGGVVVAAGAQVDQPEVGFQASFAADEYPASGKPYVSVVTRLDAFGHDSCAASGVCIAKAWADCDDGKVCTLDTCAGAAGCVHGSAVQEPCDDGAPCVKTATCGAQGCVVTAQPGCP